MKSKNNQESRKRPLSDTGWRWITSLLVLALLLFILASTISFNLGKNTPETNWGGFIGKILANWLWQIGGYGIYLIIFAIGIWAVNRLIKKRQWLWFYGVVLWELTFFLILTLDGYFSVTFNPAGYIGNWFAQVFFAGLGIIAYVLPVLSGIWGFNLLRREKAKPYIYYSLVILSGSIIVELFLSYFLTNNQIYSNSNKFYIGGLFGRGIILGLVSFIGRVGTLLLILALLIGFSFSFTKLRTLLGRIKD